MLRSVPGGEKANVGWFQVSLNSAGQRVCRFPSSPLPVQRLAMNGSVQSTAVVQLWAGPGDMPKPVEPSGAEMISDSERILVDTELLERQMLRSSEVMQFRAIAIRRTNSASLRPFRSTMASKIGERVHHVYHIAVHLDLLGWQGATVDSN